MKLLALLLSLIPTIGLGQSYTNYFTGSPLDVVTSPQGGVCLMGGATEHDEAMKWFLTRANGGDVLVLRTSGSDGYNDYMYTQLGITVNSVETIVFNNSSASNDPYVQQKISQAEAIWFAGGDQWNYVSYWRGTPVDSLINIGLLQRNIVIGGTSAGMAIQGKYYFSAENGTVTSSTALGNPYNVNVTVDSTTFLKNDFLEDVITDTHYNNPDRKGRHVVFLARILTDYGVVGRGVACDEYTAICIDENGMAHCYGEYPTYNENVYFIQPNCELADYSPENCSPGNPLEWNHSGEALKVYHVKPTMDGSKKFDMSSWTGGNGGEWKDWRVINGVLQELIGDSLECTAGIGENQIYFAIYPNPAQNELFIEADIEFETISIIDLSGKRVSEMKASTNTFTYDISGMMPGIYFLEINVEGHLVRRRFEKQ